jgi:hypothetical protein
MVVLIAFCSSVKPNFMGTPKIVEELAEGSFTNT